LQHRHSCALTLAGLCGVRSNNVIRCISGVMGVSAGQLAYGEAASDGRDAAVERLVGLILTAAPALLKELARVVADYARSVAGVHTIVKDPIGGPTIQVARKLLGPSATAIDESDPVAGPQLLISEYYNGRICQ
jgi:hypothetical protein